MAIRYPFSAGAGSAFSFVLHRVGIVALVFGTAGFAVRADGIRDTEQALDEVTVYGSAVNAPKETRSVTVIDRQAILNAPTNSLIDLLSREANVTLRSFTGHDKFGGIDIRGMGDTFASNVLILVDGMRLNAPDLSGADFSTLSLGQIERIEIVRGNGGVQYGDGAVGGAVNIVTRKAQQTRSELYSSHGSFDTWDTRVNAGAQTQALQATLNAAHYQTGGYRDNTFLDKNQLSSRLSFRPSDAVSLGSDFRIHDDEYGLAGPVDAGSIDDTKLRRQASTPFGGGGTHDYAGALSGTVNWGSLSETRVNLAYRYRDNPYETANYWSPDRSSVLPWNNSFKHGEVDARHQFHLDFGKIAQDWTLGYYRREGTALRREIGRYVPDQSALKQAEFNNQSGFLQTTWYLPARWIASAGYRRDTLSLQRHADQYQHRCTYSPVFPFPPISCADQWTTVGRANQDWRSDAADAGLSWEINGDWTWYGSYSLGYRNPNPEELVLAADDLRPQRSKNWESGLRWHSAQGDQASLGWFQMVNQAEIYYDNSVNRNYTSATLRRGVELQGRYRPADALTLSGNVSYIDARFEDSGLRMPLVPELKGQIGLLWHADERLSLSLSAEYVGRRNNGATLTPTDQYPRLRAYQKVDIKAFYQVAGAEISAGINNLFNAFYETSAYGGAFYPMPERQFYLGVTYAFSTSGEKP